jgi:membrane-associated phospholipid phosphatase
MSNTAERHLPYLIAVLCGVLILGIVSIFSGPSLLKCLALFDILALSLLGIINTRWLISFHATAISAAWAITVLVFGWLASLLVLLFVGAVVVVRLFLKRHSPAQVIAGLLLGILSVYSLTLIGCFV